jgi:hypothetical protein
MNIKSALNNPAQHDQNIKNKQPTTRRQAMREMHQSHKNTAGSKRSVILSDQDRDRP